MCVGVAIATPHHQNPIKLTTGQSQCYNNPRTRLKFKLCSSLESAQRSGSSHSWDTLISIWFPCPPSIRRPCRACARPLCHPHPTASVSNNYTATSLGQHAAKTRHSSTWDAADWQSGWASYEPERPFECGIRGGSDGGDAKGRLIRVKLLIKYQFISANSKHTHTYTPIQTCLLCVAGLRRDFLQNGAHNASRLVWFRIRLKYYRIRSAHVCVVGRNWLVSWLSLWPSASAVCYSHKEPTFWFASECGESFKWRLS